MHLDPLPPGTRSVSATPPPDRRPALRRRTTRWSRSTARQAHRRLQEALYAEGKRALLVVLQGRDTAGKDGTIRKVFGAAQPAGLRRDQLQGADARSSWRTTFSGGSTRPCRRRAPSASSTARTTRTCSWSGCTSWCPKSVWRAALRADQPVRAHADRERGDDPQVLPAHLAARSSASGCWPGSTIRRSTGSSRRGPGRAGRGGTPTPRRTRRRWPGPARRRRRGTWCRRTRNTSATCWWRRWWRRRWSGWIRSIPGPPKDLEEFRRAAGAEAQFLPSGPMMMKVRVPPTLTNGSLLPSVCSSASCSRGSVDGDDHAELHARRGAAVGGRRILPVERVFRLGKLKPCGRYCARPGGHAPGPTSAGQCPVSYQAL